MNVEFATNDLRERFQRSQVAARAWGAPVARKYIERVGRIAAATSMHSLMLWQSLRVHPLKVDRKGFYTMVLHDRWRLLFSLVDDETVRIEAVSNHYDD